MRLSSQDRYRLTSEMLKEKGLDNDFETISLFLSSLDIPYGDDFTVNRYIERELFKAGLPFETNVKIGNDLKTNFLIGGCIALMCSVEKGIDYIGRLVEKVSKNRSVDGMIVVTSRNFQIHDVINGKPLMILRPGYVL